MGTKGEMSCVDVEAACESEGSLCFSDADDRSWHSRYNSNHNGSSFDEFRCSGAASREIDELCRSSCISDGSFEVDLECGSPGCSGTKVSPDKNEKDCRICQLGLESNAPESGIAMVLGCSCKDDLAAAHKQCAETWFKIRGNTTCEICGSIAKNVTGVGETEAAEHSVETGTNITAPTPPTETQRFWQGHRFLNFLLACMIFAFVISWLFHFNVRS